MRRCDSGIISSCTQSDLVSAGGHCWVSEFLRELPQTMMLIMFASQRRPFLEIIVTRKISLVPMVNNNLPESQLHFLYLSYKSGHMVIVND